jgi:hypothetical protein
LVAAARGSDVLGIWTEMTLLTRVGAALVALASWVLAYALA